MTEIVTYRKAFTLLELLVAMTLMVVVAACLYSSLYTGFRAKRSAGSAVEPGIAAANAIEILKQDISGALPPSGILAGSFLGMDSRDGQGSNSDSMIFYTTHFHTADDKPYGGIAMIELALVEDSDSENDNYRLIRYVTTNLLSPRALEADEQVLCRNVRSLNIRYFDGFSWLDEWDSTAYEDVLPQAVEIDLQVEYKARELARQAQLRRLIQSFMLPCGVSERVEGESQT